MDRSEKSERLVEAAIAVLQAAPRTRLNAVVLNKALFYLDLASLRDQGEPVTHNSYIAIQQGPVVAKYQQRLVGKLVEMGVAEQVSEWDGAKPIVLTRPAGELRTIGDEARSLAATVSSYFSSLSSKAASQYSHENPGWQLAWDEWRRTGRPQAVNMRIALQQIVEDDPWMEVPLQIDDEIIARADMGDGAAL